MTSTNTGNATERIEVVYSTPSGVTDAGSACATLATRTYRCTADAVAPGQQWVLRVRLRVEADAWRRAPLFGSATATAGIAGVPAVQQQRSYEIVFPGGPALPDLALWAGDVVLPSVTTRAASLSVRFGNYGDVPATGRLELATPAGVTLTTVSDRCQSFVRLDAQRVRCELGRIGVNQSVPLAFGLAIAPTVVPGAPVEGSASAWLTPPGGRTAQTGTTFRVLFTEVVPPSPPATSAAPLPPVVVPGAGGGELVAAEEDSLGVSIAGVIAVIVGIAAALCVFVLMSLRSPKAEGGSG